MAQLGNLQSDQLFVTTRLALPMVVSHHGFLLQEGILHVVKHLSILGELEFLQTRYQDNGPCFAALVSIEIRARHLARDVAVCRRCH